MACSPRSMLWSSVMAPRHRSLMLTQCGELLVMNDESVVIFILCPLGRTCLLLALSINSFSDSSSFSLARLSRKFPASLHYLLPSLLPNSSYHTPAVNLISMTLSLKGSLTPNSTCSPFVSSPDSETI